MAFEVIKTFTTTCNGALHVEIDNNPLISTIIEQIIFTGGITTSFFFSSVLTTAEEQELDNILLAWSCSTINLLPLDASEGTILPIVFNQESRAKNKWLSHEGDNSLSSDETPAIVPFDCKLIGITFSNSVSSVETDVQVYHIPKNSSTKTMVELWPIRASRVGHNTNVTPTVFESGSKISVYLKDRGTDVKKVVVVLYLQVLRLLQEENTENYSTSDDDDDH